MAARRSGTRVSGGPGKDVIVVNTTGTPVPSRRRSSGGVTRRRSRSGGKRRRRYATGGVGSYRTRITSMALGGAAYGFVEKSFPTLPTIPALGRAGTIAAAAYFMQPKQQLLRDIGLAAAVLAGYQFGSQGRISGVHGLAAQM